MEKEQRGNNDLLHCFPYNSVIDGVDTDPKFIKDLKKVAKVNTIKLIGIAKVM
jgi:hypothetical protein